MQEWLLAQQEWLLAQNVLTVYVVLFLLLTGGIIGLPIPEDIPLIVAGILINTGKCNPLITFVVCYTPVVLGDLFIFGVGRYFGPRIFKLRWFDSPKARMKLKRIRVGFERRGVLMIFLARHLFYLRTFTFISCGALKMRFRRFVIADMIAALISVPLMLCIGFFAADSYEHAIRLINRSREVSLAIIVVCVVSYLLYLKFRKSVPPAKDDGAVDPLRPLDT